MPKPDYTITPGLYKIGDKVRPVHDGEYRLYGHGRIVSITERKSRNPYTIQFPSARIPLSYREDEISKWHSTDEITTICEALRYQASDMVNALRLLAVDIQDRYILAAKRTRPIS